MRDFDFFSFLWRPRNVVFNNENIPILTNDSRTIVLTDDAGNVILTAETPGDLYRYD